MATLLPINKQQAPNISVNNAPPSGLPNIGISSGQTPAPTPPIYIGNQPARYTPPPPPSAQHPTWGTPPPIPRFNPLQFAQHAISALASPATNLIRTDITNPARITAAQLTHNKVALRNANIAQSKAINADINNARQFVTRPVVELATSLIPKQKTFTPNSNLAKSLLGTTSVQNIEKKVVNNYQTHPKLNPVARTGLATGEALGSLAQDIPTVSAEAKLISKGVNPEVVKAVNTIPRTEAGAVGKGVNKPEESKPQTPKNTTPNTPPAAQERPQQPKPSVPAVNQEISGAPKTATPKTAVPKTEPAITQPSPSTYVANNTPIHPLTQAFDKHYTPSKNPTAAEKFAANYIRNNPEKALSDYHARTVQQFPTNKPNVVAGDEAKYVIPGFKSSNSVAYHEPASALAKIHYDHLLGDKSTVDRPVLLMSGGTGAGKTSALKEFSLDNHSAVVDTNADKFGSAKAKIDKALESGRNVHVAYVYRDPHEAFVNGVIPRGKTQGRIVAVNDHMNTHYGANDTTDKLKLHYQGNPRVVFTTHDNSFGKNNARAVANTPKIRYNRDKLKSLLQKEVENGYKQGTISASERKVYLGQEANRSPVLHGSGSTRTNSGIKSPGLEGTRGFTQSVKQSQNYSKNLKKAVNQTSNYKIASDKEAISNVQKFANQPLNLAHGRILNKLQSTKRLSKQDIVNGGTIMQHLDNAGRTAEAQNLHELLSQRLTEAGQNAQAASLLLRRSPDGIYHKAVSDLNKAGVNVTPTIDEQLKAHREAIRNTLPDSVERNVEIQKLKQFVAKNIPTSKLNNVFAFWRAGLLTGPRTVSKILTSHTVHMPLEQIKNIPATGVDMAISKLSGKRSLALTPRGIGGGLNRGTKAGFGKQGYLRSGIDFQPGTNAVEFHQNANFGSSIPGRVVQKYVDGIGRLHGSLYKPFYGAAHLNSLYSTATAEAKNAGLKGAERNSFIENYVASPPSHALDIAKNDAENATFQQETALGKLATSLQQHGGIIGKVIAPFTRIPSAIATDLVNYSPVGAVKAIVDGIKTARSEEGWSLEAQRKFSQGIGRSITGTAAIAPGFMLYNKGLLTLEYPSNDPKEQKLWQLEGETADSIKVGGKWRALGSLGPAGSVLSIGGYLAKSIGQGNGMTQSAIDALAGGIKSIEGQSYLSGLSGVVNATQDPGRYLNSLEKQYAGSVIPTGIAQIASSFDKQARQINTPLDSLKAKIPGKRESLAPKTDVFGNNVPAGETGPGALIDPFYSSNVRPTSPVVQEMERLQQNNQGVLPSSQPTKNTFDGVKTVLTKPQAQQLDKLVGSKAQDLWNQTINSSLYKGLDDAGKHQLLSNVLSDTTSAVKEQYAANNNLGQFQPGYSGKTNALTQKQQNIIDGKFNVNDYAQKPATTPSKKTIKSPNGSLSTVKIPKTKTSTPRVTTGAAARRSGARASSTRASSSRVSTASRASTRTARSTAPKVARAKIPHYKIPHLLTPKISFKTPNVKQPKLRLTPPKTHSFKAPKVAYKASSAKPAKLPVSKIPKLGSKKSFFA